MDFRQFVGNSLLAHLLFAGAIGIVVGELLATLFTVVYQRFWYTALIRNRLDQSFRPRCAIIVPCKGIPKDLGNNLRGFLDLDYPDYSVVYITESEDDAAVSVIKEIVATNSNAKRAVAGLATTCCQKNYNLLAGLNVAGDPDVYVFADADIKPQKEWLLELVLPLSDSRITATSGFRWLHAKSGSVAELSHSYVNIFIYILFSVACFAGGVGLWGGSMAIRRKDFEELGVADKWARASVDDMSLSYLLYKKRRKAVVVPSCIIQSDDLLQTYWGTADWFKRQIMYLKAYQKNLWLFCSLPLAILALILFLALPFSIVAALTTDHSFFAMGGGAALTFYLGGILIISLYPLLGKMHSFGKFVFFWPILRFVHIVSALQTALTNAIVWAGITYHLKQNGDVSHLERPAVVPPQQGGK